MAVKGIEKVIAPPPTRMVGNGFIVHNFFPLTSEIDGKRMSPFFLLDYNAEVDFTPSEKPRGVGPHPHRGLETVTFAYQGKVAHHDSCGNSGIIHEGDLQWMTAGAGLLHKEYHEEGYSKKGGPFQMAQLWVNLPEKHKMTEPKYQAITHNEIPVFPLPDQKGRVEVIAGQYKDVKGAASSFTPMEVYQVKAEAGAEVQIDLPEHYNTGVLVVNGSVEVNNSQTVPANRFILFKNEGTAITLRAKEDMILLVLSGEPIDEPMSAYGPFLMNTKEEIIQAYNDYEQGKFGYLED